MLTKPARLTLIFWPAAERCSPVELGLIATLESAKQRFPDTRVVSVVPDGFPGNERYGTPLPGEVVRLATSEWQREAVASPFPRIEAWDSGPRLLFWRALSSLSVESETVATEIERVRALTRPLLPTSVGH
jgi:hypothetical protein